MVREHKFISPLASPDIAAGIVRAYCIPDPEHPTGDLESIYFDDAALSSYWEKANGDALKRKVRIRWYHGSKMSATTTAFLEIKDRIGSARDKARHSFEASLPLLESAPFDSDGLVRLLAQAAEEAGFAIPRGLMPSVAIRYKRFRYICPATGSRVSIDFDISCTRANSTIFTTSGPLRCRYVVCEAKSDSAREWPFGDDMMRLGFRMQSFSKYGHFTERLLQGGFE